MAYILDTIKKSHSCTLVSLAVYKKHQWKAVSSRKIRLDERETDVIMPSFGSPLRLLRGLNSLLIPVFIFLYGLFHFHEDDVVIGYHSLHYTGAINLCKKLRHFRLALEVEEVYADVAENEARREREIKLFKTADAFLFPTKMLDDLINREKKPSMIIHGTYGTEPERDTGRGDGKIHVVYAGTLDPRKGGAAAAAAAAAFLDDHYHLHIIGFGSEADRRSLLEKINCVSQEYGFYKAATLVYPHRIRMQLLMPLLFQVRSCPICPTDFMWSVSAFQPL